MALVVKNPDRKWPGGVIPYTYELGFPYEKMAREAMEQWMQESKLKFVPVTDEPDYVTFRQSYGDACSSNIGRMTGEQFIDVVPGCTAEDLLHELAHCVGMDHEQCRLDRNKHIKVHSKNFEPGFGAENWAIASADVFEDFGKYDFKSIMHYSRHGGGRRLGQYQWKRDWSTVEFYEVGSKIFLLTLKSKGGRMDVNKIKDSGVVGDIVTHYNWSSGWTIVRQYTCGFQRFLAFYKKDSGTARFYLINGDGTIGNRIDEHDWSRGWTSMEFYLIGTQCFMFLLKASTGLVHIHKILSTGAVGERVFTKHWTKGWTQAQPYSAWFQRYFSILKTSTGEAEFYELNAEGDLAKSIQNRTWSKGWTDVQFYQLGLVIFMLTYKRSTGLVHIHRIESDGKYGERVDTKYVEAGWTTVRVFTSGLGPRLFLLNSATGVVKTWHIDVDEKLHVYDYVGDVITVLPPHEDETDKIGTYQSPSAKDIAGINHLVDTAPPLSSKRLKHSRINARGRIRG